MITMKRTITLDKENFLYLFDILQEIKDTLEHDADTSYYDEAADIPSWVIEKQEKALKCLPKIERLIDSVLFGE